MSGWLPLGCTDKDIDDAAPQNDCEDDVTSLLGGTPYAALAEAMGEYDLAKLSGFDGSLCDFLEMQRREIELDHYEIQACRGLERLRELQKYDLHDKICKTALEASLEAREKYKWFFSEAAE